MANKDTKSTSKSSAGIERGQSSFELLSTYGFALIILVVFASIIYVFATIPRSIPENQCSFSGAIACKTLAFGSNSTSSRAVFLFSNSQQYAIENPSATLNISGVGSYSGTCTPNFILPGGDLECVINFNQKVTQNQITNGNVYLSATVCSLPTQTGCDQPIQQTYGGTFITHVDSLIPPPGCSMTLSITNTTETSTGTKDLITANVKILNFDVAGATVNFTSNSTFAMINPHLVNTDSNGNAQTYISSDTSGTVNLTATFGTCSASEDVLFVSPKLITFASNITSSNPILQVNGNWYNNLPRTISTVSGATVSYLYNSTVSISPGARYLFGNLGGCGVTTETGIITATSNCTVSGNYIAQYYLTLQASPPGSGSELPGSGWYSSANQIYILETPASGYTFNGWVGSGTGSYTGASSSPSIIMNGPITETADFQPTSNSINIYSLTENAIPAIGGNVLPGSGNYLSGNMIAISESPNSGYAFTSWSCSGSDCYSGTNTVANIIITSNTVETANFQSNSMLIYTFTENAIPSNAATVSPGNGNYLSGNSISISINPTVGATNYASCAATPCVYVSDWPYNMSIINTTSQDLMYRFTNWSCTGTGCYSGVNPTNTLNIGGNTVETAHFLGSIPSNLNDKVVALPNGKYIYAASSFSFPNYKLQVINTTTNQVTNTISLAVEPWYIAVSPNGNYVYVSEDDNYSSNPSGNYSGELQIIATASNQIVKSMVFKGQFLGPIVFSPNSLNAYAILSYEEQNGASKVGAANISVINTATQSIATTIPISGVNYPISSVMTPNGSYLYVLNQCTANKSCTNSANAPENVSVISTATNLVTATVTLINATINYGSEIGINPAGSSVYVSNIRWLNSGISVKSNFFTISTSTNLVTNTIYVGNETSGFIPNLSGNTIYLSVYGIPTNSSQNAVQVINTATDQITNTIPVASEFSITPGLLTPSGGYLYVTDLDGGPYVTIINTNTNSVTKTIKACNYGGSSGYCKAQVIT